MVRQKLKCAQTCDIAVRRSVTSHCRSIDVSFLMLNVRSVIGAEARDDFVTR